MYSGKSTRALPRVGFPIRKSRDQRLVSISPGLIAAAHVLHRLLAPRHPPCALSLLIVKNTLYAAMEFSRCTPAPKSPAKREKAARRQVSQNSAVLSNRGRRNSRRARNRTYSSRPSSPRSKALRIPWKGGDPAAASATATLLRLHPSHQSHLRRLPPLRVRTPASGVTGFRDVTGGVYKARERIHRGVADPRLLATPPSWRRVSASNPNRDRFFGIRSPSRVCSPLYRPM